MRVSVHICVILYVSSPLISALHALLSAALPSSRHTGLDRRTGQWNRHGDDILCVPLYLHCSILLPYTHTMSWFAVSLPASTICMNFLYMCCSLPVPLHPALLLCLLPFYLLCLTYFYLLFSQPRTATCAAFICLWLTPAATPPATCPLPRLYSD